MALGLAELLQTIENSWFTTSGSMVMVAMLIMIALVIAFMFVGVDFRFAMLIVSPSVLAFSQIGWLPKWVAIVFWMLVIAFGGYMLWNFFRER